MCGLCLDQLSLQEHARGAPLGILELGCQAGAGQTRHLCVELALVALLVTLVLALESPLDKMKMVTLLAQTWLHSPSLWKCLP